MRRRPPAPQAARTRRVLADRRVPSVRGLGDGVAGPVSRRVRNYGHLGDRPSRRVLGICRRRQPGSGLRKVLNHRSGQPARPYSDAVKPPSSSLGLGRCLASLARHRSIKGRTCVGTRSKSGALWTTR